LSQHRDDESCGYQENQERGSLRIILGTPALFRLFFFPVRHEILQILTRFPDRCVVIRIPAVFACT
jgi:hypothetical protein